jgi:hypothetical protein
MPNYALIYFLIGTMALIFALWLLRLRDGQYALNATLALGSIIIAGLNIVTQLTVMTNCQRLTQSGISVAIGVKHDTKSKTRSRSYSNALQTIRTVGTLS